MFTQPPPPSTAGLLSPATEPAASSPPSSTSRGSRLRGLSYLRNYTQSHLLSRDSGVSAQSSASGAASGPSSQHPPLTRAATHSALSVSGRRRSRQSVTADDPLRYCILEFYSFFHLSTHSLILPTQCDERSTPKDYVSTESAGQSRF
jgi:hypothetical protein